MSESDPSRRVGPQAPGARVRRTERALHEALGSLIRQRPYERIVVQQILTQARVARSTFYAHFLDKDDLLLRGLEELLRDAERIARSHPERAQRILGFGRVLYEHILTHRQGAPSGHAKEQKALHRKLEGLLAARIGSRLSREVAGGWQPPVPVDLLASHVAASFMRCLDHAMAGPATPSASDADRAFRALVAPLLGS